MIMTLLKRLILPVIYILSGAVCCLGQSIKLTGKVVDEVNRCVETASVIILRQSDRQILGSTICDSLGTFTLNCKCKGIPVLVQTRHIAFQTDSISLLLQKDTTLSIHMKCFSLAREIQVKIFLHQHGKEWSLCLSRHPAPPVFA